MVTYIVLVTVGSATAVVRCVGSGSPTGHADTPGPAAVHVGYTSTVWLTVLTKVLKTVFIVSSLVCVAGRSLCSADGAVLEAANGGISASARHSKLTLRLTASSRWRSGAETRLRPDICGRKE